MSHPTRRSAVFGSAFAALFVVTLPFVEPASAQDDPPAGPSVGHGPSGFFIETGDGMWRTELQFRFQFRYSTANDPDPTGAAGFQSEPLHSFDVRRARLKIGGHGWQPWLRYYFEYDLPTSTLLNWEVRLEKSSKVRLRLGQWKAYFSRERIVSSGRLQLADRSIINRYFTIDRQIGMSVYGRLAEGSVADVSYWASVFTGMGRGGRVNDDEHMMYLGRLQWNPFGREVAFSSGDVNRSDDPALSIALAGVTNRSGCTRFSGTGCGSLQAFPDQDEGRYRVNQALLETAFRWEGFSWDHESHFKTVEDGVAATETDLRGSYVQIGYFVGELFDSLPEELELMGRWASFRPDLDIDDNRYDEVTVGANWFFGGHSNKLTADFSWLDATFQPGNETGSGTRLRLQWDVQF